MVEELVEKSFEKVASKVCGFLISEILSIKKGGEEGG